MDLLVGTTDGVFDVEGRPIATGFGVGHLHRHGDEWWAVGDAGVYRDGDEVAPAPPDISLNCVLPTEHTVWVGAGEARLFHLENGSLRPDDAFASAPGRDKWHTPWGGPPDVRSMTESVDGTIYINVHVGGILRFDSAGFIPTVDIDSDVHQVVAHPDRPDVVAAATARGVAVTMDGHDFEYRTGGLDYRYCRAVGIDGDTVLVSASRGPRGGDGRLYRGDLGDGDLERCPGLPAFDGNINTHCVAVRSGTYFVGHGAEVWVSTDAGDTWEVAAGNLPSVTCLA